MSGVQRDEPAAAEDDFQFEEHSGEAPGDDSGGGLELDQFQAKEIRQIFLTTLPEYLEPVSQMIDQVLSRAEGYEQVQPAIQTTLVSISAAATRIGIHDVCSAIELIRDRLLMLDDDTLERATAEQGLRSAFDSLRLLAGTTDAVKAAVSSQTIVAAMQNIEGFDKSVLQRLTSAGLVTVDQLRMARPDEIVAVSGLDAAVVHRLLQLLLPASAVAGAPTPAAEPIASPSPQPTLSSNPALEPAVSFAPVPQKLEAKLRAQVESEASLDELRAEILRLRLSISACNQRFAAAQRRHARLQKELTKLNQGTGEKLSRLATARLREARLERKRSVQQQTIDETKSRLAKLQSECQAIEEERTRLTQEVSRVVSSIHASGRR